MRYFIYLKYDGTNYHGWQSQPNAVSVQETIEKKLSMLLRRELTIVGAGRTDAGVHASCMVAHTEIENLEMPLDQLTFKLNQVLPPDILITRIVPVTPEAHARFSATSRTYRYYITTGKPLFNRAYAMRIFEPLDIELMNHASAKLFCYEDFTSFSKLHTDTKTNICHIEEAFWAEREPDAWEDPNAKHYVFTITADRFLRNMVRAIVGTLLQVGKHRMTIKEFAEVIEGKNRCIAGDSVAAQGLFLENIEYPESCFPELTF
ncbi:MAG: tRNA pseudouridine(38-40) synthase TruA [Bacteroidales bacterium]|nr:tRNA pseudouridine(38-40) synthase TruA [Bacteroidales bacterium]